MDFNIKEIRNNTGLSQSAFASKYDISLRTLQQWEQQRSMPPEHTLKMLKRLIAYEKKLDGLYSLKEYRLPEIKSFKVCIPAPFKNCERIYPIQQRKVKELLDDILTHADPVRILIFGSSVTQSCHIGSDIDIYAELKEDIKPIKDIHDFEYDFWSNFTADDRLLSEINKKGVTVYG